jgi:general secretion pathway protein A
LYEEYWGLNTLPFENVPDPRFLYRSSQHEEALMRLLYATKSQKGAVMLTGEIGCGKVLTTQVSN